MSGRKTTKKPTRKATKKPTKKATIVKRAKPQKKKKRENALARASRVACRDVQTYKSRLSDVGRVGRKGDDEDVVTFDHDDTMEAVLDDDEVQGEEEAGEDATEKDFEPEDEPMERAKADETEETALEADAADCAPLVAVEYEQPHKHYHHHFIAMEDRRTRSTWTKYELARVLGQRAEQISMGAPVCVEVGSLTDCLEIAEAELKAGRLPFIIRRRFPDTSYYEDWLAYELGHNPQTDLLPVPRNVDWSVFDSFQ